VKQLVTTAIILGRTDYGEADRILSLLTPEFGKLSLLAKGVRRVKSKLAGGIELFSVSEITFIKGRGEVGTLVSTRLVKHYEHIVSDLNRTMLGYDLIKRLNRVTEDETEEEYFDLLRDSFEALNDKTISTDIVRFWFGAQLLRLSGHQPNLQTDQQGSKLQADQHYLFNFDNMCFAASPDHGQFAADDIKFLRLAFAGNSVNVLAHVQGSDSLAEKAAPLVNTMLTTYLRV
jgi:DNA repair protein RecO (recombination protein O)